MHPLQFGFVRRKVRTQRRHGMPIVNPLIFYPWRAFDFASDVWRWLRLIRRYREHHGTRARPIPPQADYMDEALTPPLAGSEDHVVDDVRRQDSEDPRRAGQSSRRCAIAPSRLHPTPPRPPACRGSARRPS